MKRERKSWRLVNNQISPEASPGKPEAEQRQGKDWVRGSLQKFEKSKKKKKGKEMEGNENLDKMEGYSVPRGWNTASSQVWGLRVVRGGKSTSRTECYGDLTQWLWHDSGKEGKVRRLGGRLRKSWTVPSLR